MFLTLYRYLIYLILSNLYDKYDGGRLDWLKLRSSLTAWDGTCQWLIFDDESKVDLSFITNNSIALLFSMSGLLSYPGAWCLGTVWPEHSQAGQASGTSSVAKTLAEQLSVETMVCSAFLQYCPFIIVSNTTNFLCHSIMHVIILLQRNRSLILKGLRLVWEVV